MIHIREAEDMTPLVDKFKDILVTALSVFPRAETYTEYFSILREIFFYPDSLDEVDAKLAIDTMDIFIRTLKSQTNLLVDYYWFSTGSPGQVIAKNVKL
jgi:hypothetical protein